MVWPTLDKHSILHFHGYYWHYCICDILTASSLHKHTLNALTLFFQLHTANKWRVNKISNLLFLKVHLYINSIVLYIYFITLIHRVQLLMGWSISILCKVLADYFFKKQTFRSFWILLKGGNGITVVKENYVKWFGPHVKKQMCIIGKYEKAEFWLFPDFTDFKHKTQNFWV